MKLYEHMFLPSSFFAPASLFADSVIIPTIDPTIPVSTRRTAHYSIARCRKSSSIVSDRAGRPSFIHE
jgi:hypothetical protein